MTLKPAIIGIVLAALALTACDQKTADKTAVAQGSTPEGTISDELPDLDLLPNDAPLADPSDVPPVPGVASPVAPAAVDAEAEPAETPRPAPPAPRPAEPELEGSIAE
ncbi:MAG: hypothetical protein ACOY7L_09245 [Pseudomonadota bacterium]